MITLVNRFGTDTTAAFGATFQIWQYVQMPAFAIGHGSVVDGRAERGRTEVGARARHRPLRRAVQHSADTTIVVVIIEIFSEQALGLFLPAGSVALTTAEHLNLIAAWSFILLGVSMVLFGVVRATGRRVSAARDSYGGAAGDSFPLAYAFLDTWQADAIWWSFPISSLIAVVLSIVLLQMGQLAHGTNGS